MNTNNFEAISQEFLANFSEFTFTGVITNCSKNGTITSKTEYVNDVKHGKAHIYYPDGSIHTITEYNQGIKEGIKQIYDYEGNQLQLQRYSNGLKNGWQERYFGSSYISERSSYVNGVKHGPTYTYHSQLNGAILTEVYYVNGYPDGQFNDFYINGQIYMTGRYVNGNLEGQFSEFYPTGQLKRTCLFVQNQRHGQEIRYTIEGTIQTIVDHSYGTLVLQNIQAPLATIQPNFVGFDKCSICLNEQADMTDPVALTCDSKHIFCLNCITSYANVMPNAVCPLCRVLIARI